MHRLRADANTSVGDESWRSRRNSTELEAHEHAHGAADVSRLHSQCVARGQRQLSHPNIVEFYEQVEWGGRLCLVMEYVEGVTLAEQLKKRGALPMAQALAVFSQIVAAVDYMHNHDIIHRDIKAANIRLTTEGCAKLLDFGIAKSDFSPSLTHTGFVIGTVEYLSPEQINNSYDRANYRYLQNRTKNWRRWDGRGFQRPRLDAGTRSGDQGVTS